MKLGHINIGFGILVLLVGACTAESTKYDAAPKTATEQQTNDSVEQSSNTEQVDQSSADQVGKTDDAADAPVADKPVDTEKKDAPPATNTPPKDPNIVEFRIAAGTATSGWNTVDKPITAKVGMTIRIFNDDTVGHRLHTGGSPCPHGAQIAPKASADCVVGSAIVTSATNPQTYDHNVSAAAPVFFNITP